MIRSLWIAALLVSSGVQVVSAAVIVQMCDVPSIPPASVAPPTVYPYKLPDARGISPTLDFYRPVDGRRGLRSPLVVVIHGGAWSSGSSRQAPIAGEARLLAAQGYAVAALDYTLVDGSEASRFPASTRDALCAVKWLKDRSDALGIDPGRIAVLGHSSGGHLAAMIGVLGAREQAFDARFGVDPLCADNRATAEVAGVAAYYPVTDLFGLHRDATAPATAASPGGGDARAVSVSAWNIAARYLGPAAADDPLVEQAASPSWWIGRGPLPPFFVVAGARDRVVPTRQTTDFVAKLEAAGRTVLHGLVGRGEADALDHGFYPFDDAATADIEDRTYGLNLTAAQVHALLQPSTCTLLSFLAAVTSKP